MTPRPRPRHRPRPARRAHRSRALALLAGGLLAPALLAGCGIRPTEVPVDAGAPASRTACPGEVLVPMAPESASPSAVPAPGPSPAAGRTPAPTPPATPSSAFVAPSASTCP
ncbi:hypothetical protein ACWEO1_17920 [Kitasatospora cineracea]